jgi:hypothetical protein
LLRRLNQEDIIGSDIKVEVAFVVPVGIMDKFKIGSISNCSALESFGWPALQNEVGERIEIFGINFEAFRA